MLTQNMQAFGTFQKPLDQDNETSQISIKKSFAYICKML